MSHTVPSSVVMAQSGRYSTGLYREYWWETVEVAVGGRVVGVAGRRVAVAVGTRLVGEGGTGVRVGVSATATVGVSMGTVFAVAVAECSGVGLQGSVGVAEGLGVLVGVGVAEGEGAIIESSGQVQPTLSVDASHSPTTAILRPRKRLAFPTGATWAPRALGGWVNGWCPASGETKLVTPFVPFIGPTQR